jgi:hypothetical protein
LAISEQVSFTAQIKVGGEPSLTEDWTMLQFISDLPADVTVDILVCREL